MIVGILKEEKAGEGRVALTPDQAGLLIKQHHEIIVESMAGVQSGYTDTDYRARGCNIVKQKTKLLTKSSLILKVKEPTIQEISILNSGQLFFSFLHLAAFPKLLKKILKQRINALAYETINSNGSMPILRPMSEIAGRLAAQIGSNYLRRDQGGRGILIGGTEKTPPANVLILGGGVVGQSAARVASGMGARTRIFEASADRRSFLGETFRGAAEILGPDGTDLGSIIQDTDLLIGAVLICGARTPRLVTRNMVKSMRPGSVIIDVSVDQGGCIETSEVTTHKRPIIVKYGVLHYGVCNMPGSVPVTSTLALTQESFPYIEAIANHGWDGALRERPELAGALNCRRGEIIHPGLKRV